MSYHFIMRALILVIFLLSPFSADSNSSLVSKNKADTVTRILNSLFNTGYDKSVRPNYGGEPVNVSVSMHLQSLSISEIQMELTSHIYFRQTWHDSRLSFEPESGIKHLIVVNDVANKIWIPDTFFANEKSSSFHYTTVANSFLSVHSAGKVSNSVRLTITTSCAMNFQYFPLDRQSCAIHIESYGYSATDITYSWVNGDSSVALSYMLEMPQFRIVDHTLYEKTEYINTGNYSRLMCAINFERALGYYLIQIYIPAVLIVVMSWIAFWLNRKATGARVTLGVTTVLTITTLMSTTNSTLPKISYIKAIDVYLETCFLLVFASFIESAVVGYICDNEEIRVTPKSTVICCGGEDADIPIDTASLKKEKQFDLKNNLFRMSRNSIDKYSRLVFPLCFLFFNIIYWFSYINIKPNQTQMLDNRDVINLI